MFYVFFSCEVVWVSVFAIYFSIWLQIKSLQLLISRLLFWLNIVSLRVLQVTCMWCATRNIGFHSSVGVIFCYQLTGSQLRRCCKQYFYLNIFVILTNLQTRLRTGHTNNYSAHRTYHQTRVHTGYTNRLEFIQNFTVVRCFVYPLTLTDWLNSKPSQKNGASML